MHRRTFLASVAPGLLLAAPAGWAQQTQTPNRIAFVEAGAESANKPFLDAFMLGLRESGYVPGKNIVVEVRWAQGRVEGFRGAFAELIPMQPQLMVVSSTIGAVEAKRATTSIPVVFVGVTDPVGSGLAKTLAQPGGNLTGLARAAGNDGLTGKNVEALIGIVPGISRIAILWNPDGNLDERRAQVVAAASLLRITAHIVEVRDPREIEAAFVAIRNQHADAIFVVTDPLTLQNRDEIVKLAASYRIPAVYEFAEFVRSGGLLAYAPKVTEHFHRAAIYVNKILHGAQPGELPIEQPTKFELVINQRTARALGITVPKELLLQADEVIQ